MNLHVKDFHRSGVQILKGDVFDVLETRLPSVENQLGHDFNAVDIELLLGTLGHFL